MRWEKAPALPSAQGLASPRDRSPAEPEEQLRPLSLGDPTTVWGQVTQAVGPVGAALRRLRAEPAGREAARLTLAHVSEPERDPREAPHPTGQQGQEPTVIPRHIGEDQHEQ